MAITLNGNGTIDLGSNGSIANLAVGGLPDNTVDNGTMADDSVGIAELSATSTASSSTFLRGDNAWATVTSGLTNAQFWRVHTSMSISSGTQPANNHWEKSDDHATEGWVGGDITVDGNGRFTFPSTGMWYVKWVPTIYQSGSGVQYFGAQIQGSHDDFSSNHTMASAYNHNRNSTGDNYAMSMAECIFDCTDTSTDEVSFWIHVPATVTLLNSGTANSTWAMFMKLGDT